MMSRAKKTRLAGAVLSVVALGVTGVVGQFHAEALEASGDRDLAEQSFEATFVGEDTADESEPIDEDYVEVSVTGSTDASSSLEADAGLASNDAVTEGMWGEAPWSFDSDTGTLTVTGDVDNPVTLGVNLTQPWNYPIGDEAVSYKEVKLIVLENPSGIVLPANSSGLFSSLSGVGSIYGHSLTYLTEIRGIGQVDTSKVTTMKGMFKGSENLTSLDVSGWDTSKVTDISQMFMDAKSLTELDTSGWDTSKVTSLYQTFQNAKALKTLDVSGWDTGKVTTMFYAFHSAENLLELDVSNWNTSNVTNMEQTFYKTLSLTELDVSKWNTSKVTNMRGTFQWIPKVPFLDVSNWDTGRVMTMQDTFSGMSILTSLDVSNWDTSNVTTMRGMFSGVSKLPFLDVSKWDTSRVTNMEFMFYNAAVLDGLDVSQWNTGNVTNMKDMFSSAKSLTFLDVSNWDTRKVKTMSTMFSGASSLDNLDVSKWDTSNVENMYRTFSGQLAKESSLTSLDLSSWDTSKVEKMGEMFLGAINLRSLRLGENCKIEDEAKLEAVPTNESYTGKWVQVLPTATDGEAWGRFTSSELIERSRGDEASGTYVWQERAAVVFDLNDGAWDGGEPAEVAKLAEAGVGDLVTIPTAVPVREGYKFMGWKVEGPAGAQAVAGASFVLAEPGTTTLTAQWELESLPLVPGIVTPREPVLVPAEECGVEGTVEIPSMVGVKYTESREGTIMTVTATEVDGWKFSEGAVTQWEFNIEGEECASENADFYVASFDLNGGDGDFPALVTTPGEVVHVYDHAPVRDGFDFVGWLPVTQIPYSTSVPSGLIKPGSDHALFGHTILVAQWEATETPTEPTEPTDPDTELPLTPGAGGNGNAAGNGSTGSLAETGTNALSATAATVILASLGFGLLYVRRNRLNK